MLKPDSERKIFTGPELRDIIGSSCQLAKSSISVFSAFVKLRGVEWLHTHVPESVVVKLITRWQIGDLALGASDLEVYEFCSDHGWKFGIDQNLHSKAYIIDDRQVFLGSQNLTSRGLGIGTSGNLELGVLVQPTPLDQERLIQLQDSCCWLTDDLYERIAQEVQPHMSKIDSVAFSRELMDQIAQPVDQLWVTELPHSTPERVLSGEAGKDAKHDLNAFSIQTDPLSIDAVIVGFKRSRVRKWFFDQMDEAVVGSFTNFGWLSSRLHAAILDEPPIKRRNVKHYVACLLEWLQYCEKDTLEFEQHRRTISFKLK